MGIGSGAGTRVAFIAESTFGTTPATPTFQVARVTNAGVRQTKSTVMSDELRQDRNVVDEADVGRDVAGSYEAEFSYGTFDDFMAAALFGAWSSDVLVNGVTPKFFTLEETLELGTTDSFSRFTGAMVNSFSLTMRAREKVTISLGMMAQKEEIATAIISGATYTAANTKPIFTASSHIASLSVGSISPAPKVRSLTLEVSNNLRTRPVVGDKYSLEFGPGDCDVTGTLECYFESNDLYQEVLDHSTAALSFTIGADANEKYAFSFPKIRFLNGERRIGGKNDDIMVSIPFRALYGGSGNPHSIEITRAVA
jgi:hypothetical protein